MYVNVNNQTLWTFKLKVTLVRYVRYRLIGDEIESEIIQQKTGKCLHHEGIFFSAPRFPLRGNPYCFFLYPKHPVLFKRNFPSEQKLPCHVLNLKVSLSCDS